MVEYKVIISPRAERSIRAIFDYYKKYVSSQIAPNIRTGIISDIKLLKTQPNIGKHFRIEDRDLLFVVSVNYKIFYGINHQTKTVNIFEVFDSRQNPSKLNP